MEKNLKTQLMSDSPELRAQAIKELANSNNSENILVLEKIQRCDTDPRLREYADKATHHLRSKLESGIPQNPTDTSPTLETYQFVTRQSGRDGQESRPKRELSKPFKARISKSDIKAAERKVQRAISMHLGGQSKKALVYFIQALKLNPKLEKNQYVCNVAEEITGLPYQAAFQSLRDRNTRKKLMNSAQGRSWKSAR